VPISGQGFDASTGLKLKALDAIIADIGDAEFRTVVLAELRAPADAVAAKMRSAVLALPKPAVSEWKRQGADNVRVEVGPDPRIGVTLPRTTATRGAWHLNRGKWRHPLFGNRSHWFEQSVTPGWFDKTGIEARPVFEAAAGVGLERAAEMVADRVERLNRL
jgi:hypothetical protein